MNDADDQGPRVGFYQYRVVLGQVLKKMSDTATGRVPIPDICNFFYTHTFSGLKILHSKVLKFATKIASRQNSVNQNWEVKFTLCVNLHTVCEITQYVYKLTHCV